MESIDKLRILKKFLGTILVVLALFLPLIRADSGIDIFSCMEPLLYNQYIASNIKNTAFLMNLNLILSFLMQMQSLETFRKRNSPEKLWKIHRKISAPQYCRPAFLLEKTLRQRCFSLSFATFFKAGFYRTPVNGCFCSYFHFEIVILC